MSTGFFGLSSASREHPHRNPELVSTDERNQALCNKGRSRASCCLRFDLEDANEHTSNRSHGTLPAIRIASSVARPALVP